MKRPSINRRLLISSLLLIPLFLGAAGFALQRAHQESLDVALSAQLQAHLLTLLAAANDDAKGALSLPAELGAGDFNRPESGLYAQVIEQPKGFVWRSASWLGRDIVPAQNVAIGSTRQRETAGLYVRDTGIGWSDFQGREHHYVLQVGVATAPWQQQHQRFVSQLWLWLSISGGALLLVMLLLVRWGLQPLRHISDQVQRMELGDQARLEEETAAELQPLVRNLNALLALTAQRQTRLRHSLDDLAHSLKTPLTILRGSPDPVPRHLLEQQIDRIDEIVSYQRQQAAIAGGNHLLVHSPVRPAVERLCSSLVKLYREPPRRYAIHIPDEATLSIDRGDLMELLGNLLENAFRHARTQVHIHLHGTTLSIEDDGPGFAENDIQRLLTRGQRADEQHPGEGIGLAVCMAIVEQYQGQLQIKRSTLGGALIEVSFS